VNPIDSIHDTGDRLEQFESEWLRGTPPDVAAFLGNADSTNPRYVRNLIEIDLRYRWRGYADASDPSAVDDHGFPLFPQLENYATLLPVELRDHVLSPDLVAEEYRVRRRWGDRPNKQTYLERFPGDQAGIETVLNGIDAESATEEVEAKEGSTPSSLASESTITHGFSDSDEFSVGRAVAAAPRDVGKFRLETLIGRGGFGEVWKAVDTTLNRCVAVKTPRQDKQFTASDLRSFRKEAEKLAMLGRVPGIVTVYECGEANGQPFIVSDYVDGESLHARLNRGPLPYTVTADIVAKVADALNRTHLKGLVHRDIKPQNILLDKNGEPFLADFGMCATEEEQLREGHATLGTFAYMSPEQARGESQRTDGRADIYSLGVVLYRMLTGRLPFIGSQPKDYVDQVLHREPRPPRAINAEIPAELERITLKCLRKAVTDRYTTAGDLAEDLRSYSASTTHPVPATGRKLDDLVGHRRLVLATLATIGATGGLGLFIRHLWPGPEQSGAGPKPSTVPVPPSPPGDPIPVTIETDPPGAKLVLHPINYLTGRVEPENRIVVDSETPAEIDLKPGDYLMVAYFDDGRFNEVYRHVPGPNETGLFWGYSHFFSKMENGRRLLPKIGIPDLEPAAEMSEIPGATNFVLPPYYQPEQLRRFSVPRFFVDKYEFTQGQRRNMVSAEFERNRDSHIVDGEDFPLRSRYTFDQFVQYAEMQGKRLLTDLEFYYVATNGGTTKFPSGDTIEPTAVAEIAPVGTPDWDHTRHDTPVFGLCSGVAEWVDTQPLYNVPGKSTAIMPIHRNYFLIKGGSDQTLLGNLAISASDRNPRAQIIRDRGTVSSGLGCRFARSAGPRLTPEDFVMELKQ